MRYWLLLIVCLAQLVNAQNTRPTSKELAISKFIDGTLTSPADSLKVNTLAIILSGSGPTDRDGNQNFLKCDALKKLAYGLAEEGFSSFRFDKRVVKDIKNGIYDRQYQFDDFVSDAKDVLNFFKTQFSYNKIVLIGHSQGSLVAMLAAEHSDGIISIAGPAESIDLIISKQIKLNASEYSESADKVLAILKSGKTTNEYPLVLASLFAPSIQPFLMSWMSHNPSQVLEGLSLPSLIITGTNDLQVEKEQAIMLAKSSESSELLIIPNMNHVLVDVSNDPLENAKSYNDPRRPINTALIAGISKFLKSL
jgi:pimeloyl-ACP methyl ester carboxylesterase